MNNSTYPIYYSVTKCYDGQIFIARKEFEETHEWKMDAQIRQGTKRLKAILQCHEWSSRYPDRFFYTIDADEAFAVYTAWFDNARLSEKCLTSP